MASQFPLTVTFIDTIYSNLPQGSTIATCATVLDTPTWSLDSASSAEFAIDANSGTVTTTVTPLPLTPLSMVVTATSESDPTQTLSLTLPVPIIQMPEFRALTLTPNTIEDTASSGDVVGSLSANVINVDPATITYTITDQSLDGALVLDGDEVKLGSTLTPGDYTATIQVAASQANQPQSFDVTVTVEAPPPAPTAQQQALALVYNPTVNLVCTSLPNLNATYAADGFTRGNITGIAVAINSGLGLPSGGSTFNYPDATGVPHAWPADQFLAFAKGVMVYVYELSQVAGGHGSSLPDSTITIA